MAIVNGYASLAELKGWIRLSDSIDDARLERAIEAASRAIDQFCGRQFYSVTEARLFDTCDRFSLRIDDAAEVTMVEVDHDADGIYEDSIPSTDYQLLPHRPSGAPEPRPYRRIRTIGAVTFPVPNRRVGLVRVTAQWGWPAVPHGINQACLLFASRLAKRRESPEGVTGFDEMGVIRIGTRDDADGVRLISPYQLGAVA